MKYSSITYLFISAASCEKQLKIQTMTKNLMLLLLLVIPFALSSQAKAKNVEQFVTEVDENIPYLLKKFHVPGTAIALIDDGEIILQKGYGLADVEKQIPVTTKTGFNIGSISKTIAAWGVMKLVHEGKLDLDAPAEQYLTRWQLPKSEFNSEGVTIRRLLSHTAGLSLHGYPGWSPEDTLPSVEESLNGKNNGPGRVEIIMEPGTEYKYSGGGYTMLQLIVEEVTGQLFEDFIQIEVLNPLGMTNSSYKIDNKIMAASSSEYDRYGEQTDFELFTAQAAAGLHTNIEDFTRFALANQHQSNDHDQYAHVLPGHVIEDMMKPVPQAVGRFGYGLGYMTESIQGVDALLAGHRGANTGWHAIFSVNPDSNDGFVMITNGGSGHHVYASIYYDWMLWNTGVEMEGWHKAKPSIAYKIKEIIDTEGLDKIEEQYFKLKENHPDDYDFSENQLNGFGYNYMGRDEIEKALAVFKLNVAAFPYSFNPYDSYGEALLKSGAKEEGIKNYRKSILLNPDNQNGIDILTELGVSTDDIALKIPRKHLKILEGEYQTIKHYDDAHGDWKIVIELEDGYLVGDDSGFRFKLVPLGNDQFVYPGEGSLIEFETSDKSALKMKLFNQYEFAKVK